MTFGQQLASQVLGNVFTIFRLSYVYPRVRQVLLDKWDPAVPDLVELESTSAISLTNEDSRLFVYQEPRVADMISIGGVQIEPPKRLPKVIYLNMRGTDHRVT
jgi:hypothetical protein